MLWVAAGDVAVPPPMSRDVTVTWTEVSASVSSGGVIANVFSVARMPASVPVMR